MAQIPHVQAGEVIRSSFINGLVDQVNTLTSQLGSTPGSSGGVLVPSVIGKPLSLARTTLTQPAVNLSLGTTIDAFGTLVDPNAPASQTRVVIGQAPPAGARATVGSAVDLLIAAQSGGGTTPTPTPVITGFSAGSTPIGQPVTILGDNFDLTAASNTITFDGVKTAVPNPSAKTSMTVIVPVIPGVPKPATVIVNTPAGGNSAAATTNVTAALGTPNPTITSVDVTPNAVAQVGQSIKINGTNFSATAANNTVSFDTVQIVPTAATTVQLTVTVPNIPGVNSGAGPRAVTLTVKVGANTSAPPASQFFVEKL